MKLKKNQILKYLSIVIIFTSWIVFYTIPRDLQYPLFFIPATLLIFYSFYPYKKENFIAFILFGIVIFRFFIPEDPSITNVSFWAAMIRATLLSSLFLIDKKSLMTMYGYFRKYLFYIMIVSLPFYLLYITGLLPIGQIATHIGGDGDGRTWNVYLFFSLQDVPFRGEIIRFPAIFDEPGFLGVILAFVLAIEKFDLSKIQNKVFLFCGILTFSLAFYLLVTVYLLLSFNIGLKYKLYGTATALILILFGYTFFTSDFERRIIDRLVSDEGYFWEGSGRVGIDVQYIILEGIRTLETKELLFGGGFQAHHDRSFTSGVTWDRLIFQLGLVFLGYLIGLILFYGSKSRQTFLFSILFILSLMQRPAIFIPIWFFLLIIGLFIDDKKTNKTKY